MPWLLVNCSGFYRGNLINDRTCHVCQVVTDNICRDTCDAILLTTRSVQTRCTSRRVHSDRNGFDFWFASKSVFSFLRTLRAYALIAFARRCCWAPAVQQSIDISGLPGQQQRVWCYGPMMGQPDRQTDRRADRRMDTVPLLRPWSEYHAGCVNITLTGRCTMAAFVNSGCFGWVGPMVTT